VAGAAVHADTVPFIREIWQYIFVSGEPLWLSGKVVKMRK
jgi:hypothetical protein